MKTYLVYRNGVSQVITSATANNAMNHFEHLHGRENAAVFVREMQSGRVFTREPNFGIQTKSQNQIIHSR